jgi:uncharacterized membrane protein
MYQSLLIIHIISGSIALLIGGIVAVRTKGDKTHRFLGLGFVGALSVVSISAIALAVLNPNMFLLFVALFAAYLALMGRQAIVRVVPGSIVLPMLLFCTGIVMIVSAAMHASQGVVVPLFFGALITVLALNEIRLVRASKTKPLSYNQRLQRHITLMGGAMISTWTAFFVVNAPRWLSLAAWTVPSIVGTLAIVKATKRHVRRA